MTRIRADRRFTRHAVERIEERIGMRLSEEAQRDLLDLLIAGEVVKLEDREPGTELVAVWFWNRWLAIVFNPREQIVLTVLNDDRIDRHRGILEASELYQRVQTSMPPTIKRQNLGCDTEVVRLVSGGVPKPDRFKFSKYAIEGEATDLADVQTFLMEQSRNIRNSTELKGKLLKNCRQLKRLLKRPKGRIA